MLLLQNAKTSAKMVSDWPECFGGGAFRQWWIAFVTVLNVSPKERELNRGSQEFWNVDMPPSTQVCDRLIPPADGRCANCDVIAPTAS